jgi:IS605 OrfB family transposase
MATATKTIIQRLEYRKPEWFQETKELFNKVCRFYFEVIQDHEKILELSNKEALTALESLTHKTKQNPNPVNPLPYNVPAMFRRAAINAAVGAARSFYSSLDKYKAQKDKALAKGKKFTKRPPVPPREWHKNVVLYKGMYKDYTDRYIMIRLYTGTSWAWVKFSISNRAVPYGWNLGCPTVVLKKNRIQLHFCIKKTFKSPGKLEKQLKENPDFKVCAVDLNMGNSQAVCSILTVNGTKEAAFFIKGGNSLQHRRKQLLGKIAIKRSQYGGILPQDTQDNAKLWQKIKNIENYEAHRVSRRIVDFAIKHDANVIVFEHLESLKPDKGKYSRRSNTKRAYWLKAKIFKFTKYKAWSEKIITTRVNPRNTSKQCNACGKEVIRYAENSEAAGYTMGTPLFLCECGKRGNADLNASLNIGDKFYARYKAC